MAEHLLRLPLPRRGYSAAEAELTRGIGRNLEEEIMYGLVNIAIKSIAIGKCEIRNPSQNILAVISRLYIWLLDVTQRSDLSRIRSLSQSLLSSTICAT